MQLLVVNHAAPDALQPVLIYIDTAASHPNLTISPSWEAESGVTAQMQSNFPPLS